MGIILQKHPSRSNIRNLVKTVRIYHNYVSDTHTHTLTDIALYNIDYEDNTKML